MKRKAPTTEDTSNTTLKVINLSQIVLTFAQQSVLSLGLSFCPTADFNCFTAVKDVFLFAEDVYLKNTFHKINLIIICLQHPKSWKRYGR